MIRQRQPIKRSKPPRRSNPDRRAGKHLRNYDGGGGLDHDRWIRGKPCCLCGFWAKGIQAAHAIARGMGGANGAWWSLIPLCNTHHRLQESVGNAGIFEKYGIDLVSAAKRYTRQHLEEMDAI